MAAGAAEGLPGELGSLKSGTPRGPALLQLDGMETIGTGVGGRAGSAAMAKGQSRARNAPRGVCPVAPTNDGPHRVRSHSYQRPVCAGSWTVAVRLRVRIGITALRRRQSSGPITVEVGPRFGRPVARPGRHLLRALF